MSRPDPPGLKAPTAARIEAMLGYSFRDRGLLRRALTHRSYAHEAGLSDHNEPLEFLGDAVIGFLVAERIFRRRTDLDEGGMTRLRASLVNTSSLARAAAGIGVGRALLLGRGEETSGGRGKASLLADALEALVGAVFLDGGVRSVRSLVGRLFGERIDRAPTASPGASDAKTELQELVQSWGWALPKYGLVEQSGPDHAREFVVEVSGAGWTARGAGTSKKRAEPAAAAAALEKITKASR